jgi:hypothetical protein
MGAARRTPCRPNAERAYGNRKIGTELETRGYQTNEGDYIIAEGSRMPDGRAWKLLEGAPSLFDGPRKLWRARMSAVLLKAARQWTLPEVRVGPTGDI